MPRAKRRMTTFSNAQAVTPNQNWNTRKTFHTSPLSSALPSGTCNFVRVNKLSENVYRIFIQTWSASCDTMSASERSSTGIHPKLGSPEAECAGVVR
jgi:hypothetical protein